MMTPKLFHIFRNTPLGRETLLQSLYFCRGMETDLVIYIPKFTKFLMYFDNDVVQIDLDPSYLTAPDTAEDHAKNLCEEAGIRPHFLQPKDFTASTLPDIPTHFDFMCCPRSISDLSSKIGLGYIGPRVRRIVNQAGFPVLITSPSYKEWARITVFFGGSANAVKSLRLGLRMARLTGKPLDIFTQQENLSKAEYEKIIRHKELEPELDLYLDRWLCFDKGNFEENLYEVPHDALVVLGAFGHGLIKDIVFGSKMEKIQSILPNNMLIVGHHYQASS